MVRAWRSLLVSITLLAACLTQCPVAAQDDPDEQLMLRLQSTIVDAEYVAADFDQVIEDIRNRYDLNIHVSWKHLESRGVRRDHRLEVRLKQVTLATLLTNVLREADPSSSLELGYEIAGGILVITTGDAMTRQRILRAYDITDFLQSGYADRRFFSTPLLSLATTGREVLGGENVRTSADGEDPRRAPGGGFGGGGGGGNVFDEGGNDPGLVSDMELAEEVIDLLVSAVLPDSWELGGGVEGSVRYHENRLLIRHTIEGHQKTQAFLDLLRATRPIPLDAEALVVRIRADRAAAWRADLGGDFPRLNEETFARLADEQPAEDVLFRGITTGQNGKRLWFSALTQRDLVVDAAPVVADGATAFSPLTGFVTSGLELIALPLIAPDGAAMRLDVQMAWVPPVDLGARDVRLAPGEGLTSIDMVRRSLRSVSTQASLQAGEAIVLSIPAELAVDGVAPAWEDYLIVRVRPALR